MNLPSDNYLPCFVDLPTVTNILSQPQQVVLRYGGAIRRFLERRFGADVAEDIAQDMALKILEGGIGKYDRSKGRFRAWLKHCVTNLVMDHFRKRRLHELPGDEFTKDQTSRDDYAQVFLSAADRQLKQFQGEHPGNLYHTLIGLLASNADEGQGPPSFQEVADAITRTAGRTITEAYARQLAHRARLKYAQFILDQVGETLDDPSPANIVDELQAIGLFCFLEAFLPPDWTKR